MFKRRKRILNKKPTRNYVEDKRYKEWRKAVRKRDNKKCQWPNCNQSRSLHCHHIRKWATNPTLRYNTSNGICLCSTHHKLISQKEEMYELMLMRIVLNKRKLDE